MNAVVKLNTITSVYQHNNDASLTFHGLSYTRCIGLPRGLLPSPIRRPGNRDNSSRLFYLMLLKPLHRARVSLVRIKIG